MKKYFLLAATVLAVGTATTIQTETNLLGNLFVQSVKADEQTTDSITDMDEFYKKAAVEVAIAEQEDISEELDMEIDQTDSENTSSMERQTKRRDSVTPELLKLDQELQKGILTYFDNCKKYGYEPSAHCKKLLASIKK